MLILLLLIIAVLFGGFVAVWAYGRGSKLLICGVCGGAAALGLFLLLLLMKVVLASVFAGFEAVLPALKLKLVEKVKGLL